ncbi:AraC family transcriptional regulator [Variovorax paradoxus]|uniref:AraC family transcriptional regulator n=1 Tax=Variovorax paradoxus TaxID=34073 RepID=UPI00278B82A4|nr:AraC family transcriptional regulator [Variovorax paradoxus]MDQ0590482.1 AraC-like DNA-binding protein [Variovorax paradoxus]
MAKLDPLNTSRYWHVPGMPGMDMLHADFTTHEYAPHVHHSYVIAVTETGGAEFKSRGRTGMAHQQALLVFNPAEPHSGRMGGSARWRYRAVYLAEPGIRHLMATLGIDQPRYFGSNTFDDPDLIASFLELHRAFDGHGAQWDPLRQQELFVHSFGTLFHSHAQPGQRVLQAPTDARVLAPVLELLRDAFSERLTLEQMAAAARLTPFQLIGAFNRTIGLTPHTYLTQLRLRAAIRHLADGRPLIEAAIASGFYDQSALTRHFKRTFGMTPLQYVRARIC